MTGKNPNSMPEQAIAVVTAPSGFFRTMQRSGGYLDPIVFLVVMGVASVLIQILLRTIGLGEFGIVAAAATGILAIFTFPLFLIIGSFIGAAIGFVIWRFMGSEESFETSYRCVAYISAIAPITALASSIPYFGSVFNIAWIMFLVVIASIEVHRIARRQAQIVFGLIGIILVLMSVNGEYSARQYQLKLEQATQEFGSGLEGKSPEELGKALGEFLKGLEEASKTD